jgi:hypothetical protein
MPLLGYRTKRTVTRVVYLAVLLIISGNILIRGITSQVPTGTWAPPANGAHLSVPRAGAATVQLLDGRLLITGGDSGSGAMTSADIYDISGNFLAAAPMNVARSQHTATALPDGAVLVAGGSSSNGAATNSAEIYDPATNTWTATADPLVAARSGHTATVLPDGTVLLAGGDSSGTPLTSLEIYNPASRTFSPVAGSLFSPRELHAAAALNNGDVIFVGGFNGTSALATSDVYSFGAGTVSAGPVMSTARQGASATTQLDGKVLVAGGNSGSANGNRDLASAELYDPSFGTFTVTGSLGTARQGHWAVVLPHNGSILIVGGTSPVSGVETAVASVEMYSPQSSGQDAAASWNGTFHATGSMASARVSATGASPSDGTPQSRNDGLWLVAGGRDATGAALSSSELYGFAWVKTDALEYAPGTPVNITGGGWQPGETVTLHFQEVPYGDSHPDLTVVADQSGTISNSQFAPDSHDIDINFILTATGSLSGSQAQTLFADAPAANLIITASPAAAIGGSFNLSWTNNGGSSFTNQPSSTPFSSGTKAGSAFSISSIGSHNGCVWNGAIGQNTTGGGSAAASGSGSTGSVTGTEANGSESLSITLNFSCSTTTTVTSSINPSAYGQPVTFTATVSSGGTPITSGSGDTVTFKDGSATLGSGTVNGSGVATFNTSSLSVGAHSILAVYGGDSNNAGSSSTAQSQTVNKASSTTSLAVVPNSITLGQSATVTATVNPQYTGTPSDTLNISDGLSGTGNTCTITLASGTGQCSLTPTANGTLTVSGAYSGDSNFATSTGTASLTVTGTPAAITSAASTTFTAGSAGAFMVTTTGTPTPALTDTGSLPSGVTFHDNGTGTAMLAGTATAAGTYPITIKAHDGVGTDATQNFTLTVNAGALASITLSPSTATIVAGGSQPYTATGFDQFHNSRGDVTGATTFSVSNGTCTANLCSSTVAGAQTVTGNDGGVVGTAMLNVAAGPITHLALTPAAATMTASGSQPYTAMGVDAFGNAAGDVTGSTTFTIGGPASCTAASCGSTAAGSYTVTGIYTVNGAQGAASLTVTAGSFARLQLLAPGETSAPGTANGKTGTPSTEYVNGAFNVTVNAVDQYWNVVNTVTDTVQISSTDAKGILPAGAALAGGTGSLGVTPETVSYNPATTTVTATDTSDNTKQADTSPAIQVIVVYTAGITPVQAATGQATNYTLTVSNAAAPNTNNVKSVRIAVPADGGVPGIISVIATRPDATQANWIVDQTQTGYLRARECVTGDGCYVSGANNDIGPGGTVALQFTTTANEDVASAPVQEVWNTAAFSDAQWTSALPLAPPEPTVGIGAAPSITSAAATTFTYGAAATFKVTTNGVPTPTLTESGALPGGVSVTDNGDGTATLAGTPGAAGTYPISITAHNGYGSDAVQSFTLTVNKADQTITFAALPNKTYGDAAFTVSASGGGAGNPVTFASSTPIICTTTGANGGSVTIVAAGMCSVTASQAGNANYNAATDVAQSFTVNQAQLAITVTGTQVYGGTDKSFTPTKYVNFVNGETASVLKGTLVCTTDAANNSPVVGSYSVTGCSGLSDPNYNISYVSGGFTVMPAPLTATVTGTQVYGGTGQSFTPVYAGFVLGEGSGALTGTLACTTNASASGPVLGTYTVSTCSGLIDPNYKISYVGGSFTVTPAPLAITVTGTQVYGGANQSFTPSAYASFVNSEGPAVLSGVLSCTTNTTGASPVGHNYVISGCSGLVDPNYNINYVSGSYTVTPASLAITVTGTQVYGGTARSFAPATYATFVNNEGPAVLGGTLACTTSALNSSPVGNYTVTGCSGLSDANYNISYLSGGFTVTPAPLIVTASSGSMTYGGPAFIAVPLYAGFVNGDTAANLTVQAACLSLATNSSPVGTYSSSCMGAADPNYAISYVAGNVMVTQATTSIALTTSVNPSTYMQLVTFTATVAPQFSGTPTGTAIFYDTVNGVQTSLGTGTLSIVNGEDIATLSTTGLQDQYPNSITAVYSGDTNFLTSNAAPLTQTVNPAPVASLDPMSLSFGNQNVNTTSKGAPITLKNIGDAPLNISLNGIYLTGDNATEFAQTNNCGSTVAAGGSCVITVTFTPADTGVATASLQIVDNDDDTMSAQQIVSLTGAGLSSIGGGSLYSDAIFATANSCGSIVLSGGSAVDSFNSSLGYGASRQLSGGNVGTNGNVTLNGSKSAIYGSASVPSLSMGSCSKTGVTGITSNGGAQVTGGPVQLNGLVTYPTPPAPSPVPPTPTQNISGACPAGLAGCSNTGSKTVNLAPGQYGNLTLSGGTTGHLQRGTYNLNSLTLSGRSILYVDSGPVVVNLAGTLSGGSPAMDVTGGSIQNPTGNPANLQFIYAGSRGMNLAGGSGSYATVYAPNALVNMSGGSDFYGSIVGSTVTNSGGTAIHYDSNLADIQGGNYIWFTAVVNNLKNIGAAPMNLYLNNSTISFTAGGTPYTMQGPNAVVTLNANTATAMTSYDLANSRWATSVPVGGVTGNTFVTGVGFQVPTDFPTGIQDVTFSASFTTDTPGVTLQWQWGAAVYNSSFSTTYANSGNNNLLGVNPEDGSADMHGKDAAGAPEAFKNDVVFGGTGGGLTNYTGYLSTAAGVVPTLAPLSVSPSALGFGAQSQGTMSAVAQTAILTNNDANPHTISSIQIVGTNAADFTQTNNCIGSLAPAASCSISVTFAPSDIGTRTAEIVINDTGDTGPPMVVYLSATGQ